MPCIPLMIYSTIDEAANTGVGISEKSKKRWQDNGSINLYLLNFRQYLEEYRENFDNFEKIISVYKKFNNEECITSLIWKLNSFSNKFNNINCISELLLKYYEIRFDKNSKTTLFDYHIITSNLFEDVIYEIPNNIARYLCLKRKIKSTRVVNYLPEDELANEKLYFKKIEYGMEINLGLQNFTEAVYESLAVPIPQSCILIISFFQDGSFQDPFYFVVSEGVDGEKLEEMKLENKEYILEPYNTGLQILMMFLTEPGDGSQDNYIYSSKFKTFIPIDNDIQFVLTLPREFANEIDSIFLKHLLSLDKHSKVFDLINIINIDNMIEFLTIKFNLIKSSYDYLTRYIYPIQILSNLLSMMTDQTFSNINKDIKKIFQDFGSISLKFPTEEINKIKTNSALFSFRKNYDKILLKGFSLENNEYLNLNHIHNIIRIEEKFNELICSLVKKIYSIRSIISDGCFTYEKIHSKLFQRKKNDSEILIYQNLTCDKNDLMWIFEFYSGLIKDQITFMNNFLDHVYSYLYCFPRFNIDYEKIKEIYEIFEHRMNTNSSIINLNLWDIVWNFLENDCPNFRFFRYFLKLTVVKNPQSETILTNYEENEIYFVDGYYKYRTFKNKIAKIFYDQNELMLRKKDGNIPGRSLVIPFPNLEYPEIYFKVYPEFPLLEKISLKFMDLIKFKDEIIPDGLLIIIKLLIKQNGLGFIFSSKTYSEKYIPIYVSRAIQGDLLFRHALWTNDDFDYKLLDNDHIMKFILFSLLVNPEDAKDDNFIVQKKDEKLFLISIDNDHGFLPCSTDYEYNSHRSRIDSNLVIKNLIFCLPQMNQIIPDNIKKEFIDLLSDEKLFFRLSSFIGKYETKYTNALEKYNNFEAEWNNNLSFINVCLNEKYIEELIFRIKQIQLLLEKKEITFLQIMKEIDSYMHKKYHQVFNNFPFSLKKRFDEFYKNHSKHKMNYKNNGQSFDTSINTSKHHFEIFTGIDINKWRKERNKNCTDTLIIDKISFYSDDSLKIRKILERYDIQNEILPSKGFFQGICGMVSRDENKAFEYLLRLNQLPQTIGIFNTSRLNSKFFSHFLSQIEIQPRVQVMDLRNGENIDDGIVNLIEKYFPNLEYLNLSNCRNLRFVFINKMDYLTRLRLNSCSNLKKIQYIACPRLSKIEYENTFDVKIVTFKTISKFYINKKMDGKTVFVNACEQLRENVNFKILKLNKEACNIDNLTLFNELILNSNSIVILIMKKCNLNEISIKLISDSIMKNKSLEFINFKTNLINDEAINYLSDAIINNRIIKKLNLSNNKITNNGLMKIIHLLKVNNTVQSISLWNNLIEPIDDSFEQFIHNNKHEILRVDFKSKFLLLYNSRSLNNYPSQYKDNITLKGHSSHVLCLVHIKWDKDEFTIASGGRDRTIVIWNIDSKRIIKTLKGHSDSVYCIVQIKWEKDQFTLASGSGDNNIIIWHIDAGTIVKTLLGHTGSVICLTHIKWDRDENTLASGSYDGRILIWNIDSGNIIMILKGHSEWVLCQTQIKWDKDLSTLASGSSDKSIIIWNMETKNIVKILKGHSHWVLCIVQIKWDKDQFTIASGSYDGIILLWNIDSGTIIKTLKGHSDWVKCLTTIKWDKNNYTLASGSWDKKIIIWNVENGKILKIMNGHFGYINCLVQIKWDKDECTLASGGRDKNIIIWN